MNDRIFKGVASSLGDILDGGSIKIAKYVVVEEECQYLNLDSDIYNWEACLDGSPFEEQT